MTTDPLLELDGLTKRFGRLTAVDDVSRTFEGDDLTAIIGPNGAGKTTLYHLISGFLQPSAGTIRFRGEDVTSAPVSTRVSAGLGRSFQLSNVFEELTVRKNIRIPVIARTSPFNVLTTVDRATAINEETERVLELLQLEELADEIVENLSYGDTRRVEIGITLATDPSLVLLDEPTAGMTPEESRVMTGLIDRLDDETNVSFILTEHDMDVIFSIASRVIVLQNGRIISDGTVEEVRRDDTVREAYLGGEL